MDPLLKALADMPPPKKKRHMVTVDGQSIEVSLQKKLEIMRSGESAFMIKDGNIVLKPRKRTKVKCKVLVKADVGAHFLEDNPYWIEDIAEKGYQWQIKSG